MIVFPKGLKPLWDSVKIILSYSAGKLRPYRTGVATAAFLKLAAFPLGLAIIYLTKAALDRGIFAGNLEFFIIITLLGLGAYFANHALGYLSEKTKQKVRNSFSIDVNRDFSRALFDLEYLKITRLSSTENSYLLDYDYANVENVVFGEIPSLASFLKVPAFLVLAFMLSAPLTLLVLLSVPAMAVNVIWASRGRNERHRKKMFWERKHQARLNDTLLNIKMIKSFGKENWALERVMEFFARKKEALLEVQHFGSTVFFISNVMMRVNTALFWLIGGYLIIKGSMSFGAFTAVSMYTALIMAEVDNLGHVMQGIYAERHSIERCARFIGEFTAGKDDFSRVDIPGPLEFKGDLEFREVAFSYPGGKPLFEGLSFTLPAGKWTLIKGASGAGKTTLLCLLLRLLRPDHGVIRIGGADIWGIPTESFHRGVAIVHQEPYILNDTLLDNVLLGEDRDREALGRSLSACAASSLVDELPLGYNTELGESGHCISGGQRQRVSIARALARRPGILVLDEATSFVDEVMEEEIFRRIKEVSPGLTVIFVTHRESGAKFADEVLLLENGMIHDRTGMFIKSEGE